ncbi:DUF7144 family membrane protein [Nocardia goodfellowii]|uniref:Lysylphosphatidylglycerol synthetase-like protein (DUF2156 family) n=1 Tax=Nocardia goodfellowii TaxID=882446 RepID=A0ABS4QHX6_9NOCA|nr:hypothetical protein [Nocardia goodfellowii]MBP2191301.1 lysylphosphatidylglycerol synthetase-like protein (DUF2156 family) [Nocardia goodfellowii]
MSHSAPEPEYPTRQAIAMGTSIGAAILLFTVGLLNLLQGISAVAEDNVFVVGPEYAYKFDLTTWGWIHVVVGILLLVCSFGLATGTTWGKVAAITLAAVSIVTNFLALPYYPAWSILIIALDVVVIWAVSTWMTATE